jgi:hypothetical protein
MALSAELLKSLIPFRCPNCDYMIEAALAEVLAQSYCWCRGCRQRVRLVDVGGSVAASLAEVDQAVDGLRRAFPR